MTHGGLERIGFFVRIDFNQIRLLLAVFITHILVIYGVRFFIRGMCIVYVCLALISSIITSLGNVSYIVS